MSLQHALFQDGKGNNGNENETSVSFELHDYDPLNRSDEQSSTSVKKDHELILISPEKMDYSNVNLIVFDKGPLAERIERIEEQGNYPVLVTLLDEEVRHFLRLATTHGHDVAVLQNLPSLTGSYTSAFEVEALNKKDAKDFAKQSKDRFGSDNDDEQSHSTPLTKPNPVPYVFSAQDQETEE
jgi:hypothetical protein